MSVHPSIAQLVERWTVVEVVIHRSLVRIRLEGCNIFASSHLFYFKSLSTFSKDHKTYEQHSCEEGYVKVNLSLLS